MKQAWAKSPEYLAAPVEWQLLENTRKLLTCKGIGRKFIVLSLNPTLFCVRLLHKYSGLDPTIFTEIAESQTKKLNGKVFIYHPHIATVRKGMNAFVAKDKEKWASFYAPKAIFSNSSMQVGEYMNMEEHQANMAAMFFKEDFKFKVEQRGYPDCIYYEKNDMYVVYSWWNMMYKKDGKIYEYPFMLSHDFNDEGLIVREHIYVSSNHLENL